MNNSAINKTYQHKMSNKQNLKEQPMELPIQQILNNKSAHSIKSNKSKLSNKQCQTPQQQSNFNPDLFKFFRSPNQFNDNNNNNKNNPSANKSVNKKSNQITFQQHHKNPIFHNKEQQFLQPNSQDSQTQFFKQTKQTDLVQTIPTIKLFHKNSQIQFIDNQLQVHSNKSLNHSKRQLQNFKRQIQPKQSTKNIFQNSFKSQQNFSDQRKLYSSTVNIKKSIRFDKQVDFQFGQGLQGIQQNKITGNFGSQTQFKPFRRVNSTLSPQPSNFSASKKYDKNINKPQFRASSRSFFKRQMSDTQSNNFLRSNRLQGKLNNKKQSSKNTQNTTIIQNKQNQSKGSRQKPSSYNNQLNINKTLPIVKDAFYLNSNQSAHISLANNISRLLFKYNGGHATTLYNYRLKIKNESKVKLGIKIKCTSPRHYQVKPHSDTYLNPGQIFHVTVQLKLFSHDLNPTTLKHDITRYKHDRFKIYYWNSQSFTESQFFEGQKILPVVIQQTQEQKLRNQSLNKNLNNQKIKLATQQTQISIYRQMVNKNKVKEEEINKKIAVLNSKQFYIKYFTKQLFAFTAIVGAGIGFWLG